MKKASLLMTTLFFLSTAPFAVGTADAQSRTQSRGTVKKVQKSERTTTGRSHTRTTRSHRTIQTHRHRSHPHGVHRHHRSGVHVQIGTPYYGHRYYGRHYYGRHSYGHRHTVVYDRTPEVVVVEAEPRFVMPGLECPIRTDEERSGLQQWCATSRGTKHGLYRRWHGDGVLAAEGEYEYDVKSGVWVEFHANGAIREEGEYLDGKRVGTWITWGSDGQELVVVDY